MMARTRNDVTSVGHESGAAGALPALPEDVTTPICVSGTPTMGFLTEANSGLSSDDARVIAAVEEYLRQWEAGSNPNVDEFVEAHLEIAGALRRCLVGLEFVQAAVPEIEASTAGIDQLAAFESLTAQPLGDYRIIRELGRGGMGVVYEAEQMSLSRRVALKILPFAAVLDPRHLQRFKNEALAAAHLDHPNIVEVFGVGCERGIHFYAMRYVEGQTLAAVIDGLKSGMRNAERGVEKNTTDTDSADISHSELLNPNLADTAPIAALSTLRTTKPRDFFRTIADLGIQAAEALDHAHRMGIVHRDIKPSNLMIECSHLAPRDRASRKLSPDEASTAHHAERNDYAGLNADLSLPAMAGTLNPPKLWITDFGLAHIDSNATLTMTGDLLGTLRYMSPEQAEGRSAILDNRTDIYSLGITLYELFTLRPGFATNDRQSLLSQILNEQPLPPRSVNPTMPVDLETIVLKCLAKTPADRYRSAQNLADDLRRFINDKPIAARRPTPKQRLTSWSRRHRYLVAASFVVLAVVALAFATSTVMIALERQVTESHRIRAEAMANELRERLYAADVKLAHQAFLNGDLRQVLQLLERCRPEEDQDDLRGFEWHYLWRLSHSERRTLKAHAGEVYSVAFSPTGQLLATAGQDGSIKLWNTVSGKLLSSLVGNQGEISGIAFSPDGETLTSAGNDGTVCLWDVASRRRVAVLRGHVRPVFNAIFSPDGKWLATAGKDSLIKLWDAATLEEKTALRGHTSDVEFLAFSPDSQTLASVGDDRPGSLKLWNVARGDERKTLHLHDQPLIAVAFNPNSEMLATASEDATIKLLDATTHKERHTLSGHASWVQSICFSPDGQMLTSASIDGSLRLWDMSTGEAKGTFRGHMGRVWCVAFSPDGRSLASAGADGTVKLWDAAPREPGIRYQLGVLHFGLAQCISFHNMRLATYRDRAMIRLFDPTSDKDEVFSLQLDPSEADIRCFALSTGEGQAAVGYQDGSAALWDLCSRRERFRVRPHTAVEREGVLCIALSPDGQSVASAGIDYKVQLWSAKDGKPKFALEGHSGHVTSLAFSPDGALLATASDDSLYKLWNTSTGQLQATGAGHRGAIHCVAFSTDGGRVATAGHDGTVRLWDSESLNDPRVLVGHAGPVNWVAFSPDGRTVASGGDDRAVRLWSVTAGQELFALEGHLGPIRYLAFQNDCMLASVATNGFPDSGGELILWPAAP